MKKILLAALIIMSSTLAIASTKEPIKIEMVYNTVYPVKKGDKIEPITEDAEVEFAQMAIKKTKTVTLTKGRAFLIKLP